jgi:hypothetical protein
MKAYSSKGSRCPARDTPVWGRKYVKLKPAAVLRNAGIIEESYYVS